MMAPAKREEQLRGLLSDLQAAITTTALYGSGHPRAARAIAALADDVRKAMSQPHASVSIAAVGEELLVDGQAFTHTAPRAARLARNLQRAGLELIRFTPGVAPGELQALLEALAAGQAPALDRCPHIQAGPVAPDPVGAGSFRAFDTKEELTVPPVRDRVAIIQEALVGLAAGRAPDLFRFEGVVDIQLALLRMDANPLSHLAPWLGEELWPAVHAHNVSVLAAGLARLAGLPAAACHELGLAGLFHDAGKVSDARDPVNRKLALSGDGVETVLDHPRFGLDAVLAVPTLPDVVVIVAYEHRLGYYAPGDPRLRKPRRPHPATRLVAVADALDRLLTARGRSAPEARQEAARWIADHEGTELDSDWGRAARAVLEAHPA